MGTCQSHEKLSNKTPIKVLKTSGSNRVDTISINNKLSARQQSSYVNNSGHKTKEKSPSFSKTSLVNSSNSSCEDHDVPEGRDPKLKIRWQDILLISDDPSDCIIGRGNSGMILHAIWKRNNRQIDVAIKVIVKPRHKGPNDKAFDDICNKMWDEIELIKEAERSMANNDCIIKAYGLCHGQLPLQLSTMFTLPKQEEAVAIVMKYEVSLSSNIQYNYIYFPRAVHHHYACAVHTCYFCELALYILSYIPLHMLYTVYAGWRIA